MYVCKLVSKSLQQDGHKMLNLTLTRPISLSLSWEAGLQVLSKIQLVEFGYYHTTGKTSASHGR